MKLILFLPKTLGVSNMKLSPCTAGDDASAYKYVFPLLALEGPVLLDGVLPLLHELIIIRLINRNRKFKLKMKSVVKQISLQILLKYW